ncbi:ABC transporter ATP-binding protein [Collinsella sp. An307]|uniref:ABC transporter ATP-binding protein n=1 Tax=Collinsella sp. An307 TaxID=1965630 RepID=UPI00195265F1|nr:ABC transporter ATP-binding protein [Collinsella sp. An307]
MLVSGSTDFSGLAAEIMKLGVILVIGVLASWGFNRLMVTISQGTMRNLREEVFDHMELPLRFFDTHQHGDIMSVYTNDIDTLRQFYGQTLPQLVNSTITLVVTFTNMVALSVPLTAISVVMVVIMLVVMGRVSGFAGSFFAQQQTDLGAVDGYIEEMMDGQKVVKVFNHEADASADFRRVNDRLRESSKRANLISNLIMPLNANLGNISCVIISVVGGWMAFSGGWGLTLGALASFITLNRNFSQPVTQVSQQMSFVTMAAAGARRVFELLDEEPEADEGYVTLVNAREMPDGTIEPVEERTGTWAWKWPHRKSGEVEYVKQAGELVRDHVDFGYTPEKTVLHDITLFAKPGQKIAFVGSTGAGKTTITNLINRFYDIEDGKIRYDGININKIRKGDLRRSLGIVLQDTHLFTGTVMDNIRYGRLDATDEECMEAARLVHADGFIRRLPQGYQTPISGDGAELSQGQCQLLAIARAAVADPPALILDEATSSIDTRTEEIVARGMDALMAGRTTLVIAHRLSTVKNADCIMVMEQGRIIERGNHDELMEQRGRYWQLYTGDKVGE